MTTIIDWYPLVRLAPVASLVLRDVWPNRRLNENSLDSKMNFECYQSAMFLQKNHCCQIDRYKCKKAGLNNKNLHMPFFSSSEK